MSNLWRPLLIGMLSTFLVWGTFFASVDQQAGIGDLPARLLQDLPHHLRAAGDGIGFAVDQLLR